MARLPPIVVVVIAIILVTTVATVRGFGPNITVCRPSFTDMRFPVSCCPRVPDASQRVVDFRVPRVGHRPPRVRRPAHIAWKDREYVKKYERAVAKMKALPDTHPHSWTRQANVHCVYCTGAYRQQGSRRLFKVHGNWYFYPWHRAFLYFHERILAKLAGDKSFALPYWQWDHPDGMQFPGMYLSGSLRDSLRDPDHFPPALTDNNYQLTNATASVAGNLDLMYNRMVSAARLPELFMGCRLRPGKEGNCDAGGTVELAPHNTLHAWVGARNRRENEDMGAFYSAARDPVFYAHHGNVDRVWEIWRKLHGNRLEFSDEVWLNTQFYFYDENLVLNRVRVRDFLDIRKLGYAYEKTDLPWLKSRPSPAVDPAAAREELLRQTENGDAGAGAGSFGSGSTVLNGTVRLRVARPARRRLPDEEEVLVVYGIQVNGDVFAKFSVYVNVADEGAVSAAGPQAREFAGTFVSMRRGVRAEWPKTRTLKLGISELLRDLGADDDDAIWVSLVPEGGTGANVAVAGVRIEFMTW